MEDAREDKYKDAREECIIRDEAAMLSRVFLGSKGFSLSRYPKDKKDLLPLVEAFSFDMECAKRSWDGPASAPYMKAGMKMINTYQGAPATNLFGKCAIAIDAGGTNFRSALVSFNKEGKGEVSRVKKSFMPGVDKSITKKEFFSELAARLEYLKDAVEGEVNIGFCFSYGMKITPEHEGISMSLSKEIKVEDFEGTNVGESLKVALVERGWSNIAKIVMLNDTEAALLSGVATSILSEEGVSGVAKGYLGFILGTGVNVAYVDKDEGTIIVTEGGECDKMGASRLDDELDSGTKNPGHYRLEKMTSGGYLGTLCFIAMKSLCASNILSPSTREKVEEFALTSTSLLLKDITEFMEDKEGNAIEKLVGSRLDEAVIKYVFDCILERSANISASMIVSALKKSKSCEGGFCVVCDGTTYYKAYRMKKRIERNVRLFYSHSGGADGVEFIKCEHPILLGSSVLALQ